MLSLLMAMLPFLGASMNNSGQELIFDEITLCEALGRIRVGERIPVAVSGVYGPNYFYDPEELICDWIVDSSSTCVEFAPDVGAPAQFEKLREKDLRVFATFKGVLHGPTVEEEAQDPGLMATARLAAQGQALHCGRIYGTKLVVDSVLDFKKVPPETPWPEPEPRDKEPARVPSSLKPASYPWQAVNLSLEGDVVLDVEVVEGKVQSVKVQFGDPVLAGGAASNVESWTFSREVNKRFSVVYEFRLERRTRPEGTATRLEMELPVKVRVIGARRW